MGSNPLFQLFLLVILFQLRSSLVNSNANSAWNRSPKKTINKYLIIGLFYFTSPLARNLESVMYSLGWFLLDDLQGAKDKASVIPLIHPSCKERSYAEALCCMWLVLDRSHVTLGTNHFQWKRLLWPWHLGCFLRLRMPAGLKHMDCVPVASLLFILESTVGESSRKTRGF